ncbi:MAG: hypothetical protein HRT94_07260 [Alphaproteobacteria bacterium]|nr:hypothetical protein [Alphaproteobacteria bacterium]
MNIKYKKTLILTVMLAALAVWGYLSDVYVSGTWRYKITIEIDTPEGVKSGSVIREVSNSASNTGMGFSESTKPAKVSGEAVVVDLGEKGKLFALINWRSYTEFSEVFVYRETNGIPDAIRFYKNVPAGSKGELTNKMFWPEMVRFRDISDAKSIEAVNKKDISKTYGDGYAIKRIIIEATNEPKSQTGILEEIPQFNEEFRKWRKTLPFNDSRKVSGAHFNRGMI